MTEAGRAEFEFVRDSGLPEILVQERRLIPAREMSPDEISGVEVRAAYLLEHPRLAFMSYPYEWPFRALKEAALLTLRVHLAALGRGVTLSDASAYNVAFVGPDPLFIDYLSFRRYRDGEFWYGHRQFCRQFLNPLLLTACTGVPFHNFYRGSIDGIPSAQLRWLLPWRRKLGWRVLTNVVLQAKLEAGGLVSRQGHEEIARRKLPKSAFCQMLSSLEHWVAGLKPLKRASAGWGGYGQENSYAEAERQAKRRFVGEFASTVRPSMLWDLGCNTGEYTQVALESGAGTAVAFDMDHDALDAAFVRARTHHLPMLVLYADAVNPSPDQGWAQRERAGLGERGPADAVLALALIHHLVIANNVPLADVVSWILDRAPTGVIEFVPKRDPMVQTMLAGRADIFDDYREDTFLGLVAARASVVKREQVTATGRLLVWFAR